VFRSLRRVDKQLSMVDGPVRLVGRSVTVSIYGCYGKVRVRFGVKFTVRVRIKVIFSDRSGGGSHHFHHLQWRANDVTKADKT